MPRRTNQLESCLFCDEIPCVCGTLGKKEVKREARQHAKSMDAPGSDRPTQGTRQDVPSVLDAATPAKRESRFGGVKSVASNPDRVVVADDNLRRLGANRDASKLAPGDHEVDMDTALGHLIRSGLLSGPEERRAHSMLPKRPQELTRKLREWRGKNART